MPAHEETHASLREPANHAPAAMHALETARAMPGAGSSPPGDPIAAALARLPMHRDGGLRDDWRRVGSASTRDGAPRWVYQASVAQDTRRTAAAAPAADELMVVSTSAGARQDARALEVPGVGILSRWRMQDDAELPTLRPFLRRHPDARVLRYRPGKRATFLVGNAIAKVFADDRGAAMQQVHRTLGTLRTLPCAVPMGLRHDGELRAFWQSRLPGTPLEPRLHGQEAARWLARIADSLAALHGSDLRFPLVTDLTYQQRRSARYLANQRVPAALGDALDLLCEDLDRMCRRLRREGSTRKARPLHGSPHVHQWLVNDDRLALVDFDRAGMGDGELDLATLLAELDFEPALDRAALGAALLGQYRAAGGRIDDERLAFYRAHKHLAKAVKQLRAASDVGAPAGAQAPVADARVREHALQRVQRTVQGARQVLAGAPMPQEGTR